MIKPRIPSGPPPKPLNAEELGRVLGWQRRMYQFYGVAMALIALGFFAVTSFPEQAALRPIFALVIVGLMAAGALVQFREKCPRCGSLLGRQSRFILAPKCKSCGVGFPRADNADHAPRA